MSSHIKPIKDNWDATLYNKNAAFVYSSAYTSPVVTLLNPQQGERILDLGCGSGELTMELQKAVGLDGKIVGVDFSENMISKAASNGCQNVFVGDAQALMFPDDMVQQGIHIGYDAVFSNAALHWCKRDPRGVIYSVRRVLKNDGAGRFVAEMGGYMNCIGVRSALHLVLKARGYKPEELDPWYFPSIEEYRTLLEEEGFEIKHISLNPRITNLPGDLKDWLRTFCRTTWLGAMSDEEAEDIISEVEQISSVDSKDSSGRWAIMYVRLRFEAVLPGVV